MAVKRVSRPTSCIVLLLCSWISVHADNFRGQTLEPLFFDGPSQQSIEIATGEVAIVQVDTNYPFIAGFEIVATPGPEGFGQDFALAVWGSVDPPSSVGMHNLVGVEVATTILTGRSRIAMAIPFRDVDGFSPPPGTTRTQAVNAGTGAIAVQLVPFMKGISPEALDRQISLQVRPILRPVGGILVRLQGEPTVVANARASLQLNIDGRDVRADEVLELPPGIYRVSARAGDLLDFTGNVGVEIGSIEILALTAAEPRAEVRFDVPSIAEVFWDGERVPNEGLSVPPGVHTVLIRVGDYSVSRQIAVEGDGTYRIGLDLDILMNQD